MRTIRSGSILAGAFLLTACIAGESTYPSTAPSKTDDLTSVFVAGDSLSHGMFASSEQHSFVDLVLSNSAPAELTLVSQPSGTLQAVASTIDVPTGVDVAIVELGTNDVEKGASDEEFGRDYESLLSAIRDASPNAKIVCTGTWTGWGWTHDEAIRKACVDVGGAYVHLRDLFNTDPYRGPAGQDTFLGMSDEFHPNDAGHAAIARRINDALASLR